MRQLNSVLKNSPPLFGCVAILLLLFKLPHVPELFGIVDCTTCTSKEPYLPMIGAAYFSLLIAISLTFSSFPNQILARAGLFFSLGTFVALTALNPDLCVICLLAHGCHIAMWSLWLFFKEKRRETKAFLGLRLSVVFIAPVSVMALFSTLNFTFLVYGLRPPEIADTLVKAGTEMESFSLEGEKSSISKEELAKYDAVVLNFVSPHCQFCKEQLPRLELLAQEYPVERVHVVNVGREFDPLFKELAPNLDWLPDPENKLSPIFGVRGHPTLVLLDSKGRVVQAQAGTSSNFEVGLKKKIDQLLATRQR